MRIQAINNNNFKGLFTDKHVENGGNWRMEYQPYSWESNNQGIMAPKEQLDILSSHLPDNEEIYKETTSGGEVIYKSSRDILGTQSYYHDVKHDIMRRSIEEMPAMSREDSLKVFLSKLNTFLKLKWTTIGTNNFKIFEYVKEILNNTYANSSIIDNMDSLVLRLFSGDDVDRLSRNNNKISDNANNIKILQNQIEKLQASSDEVSNQRDIITREIQKIEAAKKAGNYIDISTADKAAFDKQIEKILQGLKEALTKPAIMAKYGAQVISLPNRTLSIKELVETTILNFGSRNVAENARTIVSLMKEQGFNLK